MDLTEVCVILVTVSLLVVAYFKWSFSYWRRRNVPYRQPSIPFGNVKNPIGSVPVLSHVLQEQYDHLKKLGEGHGGIYFFSYPVWMPFGPDHLRNVLIRDFRHFVDRGFYFNERHDPLSSNVFFKRGTKWKKSRTRLTPTFTAGKIKTMFDVLSKCGEEMGDAVRRSFDESKQVDIKDLSGRFTTDIISSFAFGLEANSCRNPDEEFRKYGRMVLNFSTCEIVKNCVCMAVPELCETLGVPLIKRRVAKFFYGAIKNTVEHREKNNAYRKDVLQMLMAMKNNKINNNSGKKEETGLTLQEIAGEAFALYVAGFETSASTQTFAFLEIALDPDIQERARKEIHDVLARHDGEITYEALNEMTYVQQVVEETLRKYPVFPILMRQCVKDYKIENTNSIIDNKTRVFIPIYALHRDPDNFPDPERFDPERFSVENKGKIKPFTYLPFGDGPRNCIGIRLGIMESKLGIATVLRDFRISLNEKTKLPVEFNSHNFVLEMQGGVYLNLEKIKP